MLERLKAWATQSLAFVLGAMDRNGGLELLRHTIESWESDKQKHQPHLALFRKV